MKRLFVFFLVAWLAAGTIPAQARTVVPRGKTEQRIPVLKPVIATYNVFVGGVEFLTADVLFVEEAGKYRARVKAHTYGFWYKLFPWDSSLEAKGAIAGDHFVPALYTTRDVFKNKPKASKLVFDTKGNITPSFDPPSHDTNREIVTEEQKRGALDPVTALLQMLANVAVNKSCDVTVPVFDGKRRFDITGADGSNDMIDEKGYGVYRGPARLCNADFTMVAGDWKDGEHAGFWKKSEKEGGREPFQIWLAKISPDLPEMAVRLESGSVWGLIIAHLAQWRYASPDDLKP